MVKLKRVGRFLLGRPTTWTHYRWEVRSDHIMACTDSDGKQMRTQVFNERRNACPQWEILELLVKKAESGVAFVVGK